MEKSLFLSLLIYFVSITGMQKLCARTFSMTEVAAAPSVIGLQEGDTVTISTTEEFFSFVDFANQQIGYGSDDVYGGLVGIVYMLTSDIDLKRALCNVIGKDYNTSFNGIFDGNGHSISNLYIKVNNAQVGMFGQVGNDKVGGSIKNLHLKNADINTQYSKGEAKIGGLVGHLSNSSISMCSVSGKVVGKQHIGGLVGYAENARIENCYNMASITVLSSTGKSVGGIVGRYMNLTIASCYNAGEISDGASSGSTVSGGICGITPALGDVISQCFFLTTTTSDAYPGISDNNNALYSRTAEQFASGQVAFELSSDNPTAWGQ